MTNQLSVLQGWVQELSFMQQSVLLTGIRAPDTLRKNHPAKLLMRWYRRCILVCAFDRVVHLTPDEPCGGKFTGPITDIHALAESYLTDVDEIPHHFHLHLLHGAEILCYKHPRDTVAAFWSTFYVRGVNDMHLRTETMQEMDTRLSDDEIEWKKRENFPARDL